MKIWIEPTFYLKTPLDSGTSLELMTFYHWGAQNYRTPLFEVMLKVV